MSDDRGTDYVMTTPQPQLAKHLFVRIPNPLSTTVFSVVLLVVPRNRHLFALRPLQKTFFSLGFFSTSPNAFSKFPYPSINSITFQRPFRRLFSGATWSCEIFCFAKSMFYNHPRGSTSSEIPNFYNGFFNSLYIIFHLVWRVRHFLLHLVIHLQDTSPWYPPTSPADHSLTSSNTSIQKSSILPFRPISIYLLPFSFRFFAILLFYFLFVGITPFFLWAYVTLSFLVGLRNPHFFLWAYATLTFLVGLRNPHIFLWAYATLTFLVGLRNPRIFLWAYATLIFSCGPTQPSPFLWDYATLIFSCGPTQPSPSCGTTQPSLFLWVLCIPLYFLWVLLNPHLCLWVLRNPSCAPLFIPSSGYYVTHSLRSHILCDQLLLFSRITQ